MLGLVVFREAAGLQAQELAARVDLDPTVLSKIENGKRAVKSVEVARLAGALRVSPLALLEDDPLLTGLPIAARLAGHSISAGGAYDRLVGLSELHVVLADGGIHSSPDLAGVPDVHHLSWLVGADILSDWAGSELELAAEGDRRLALLADAIESRLKVDVLIESFPGDALSGAAITDNTFPLLFVNADHAGPRSLFTLAHELGHLLAGHRDEGNITFDRELASSTDEERLANAFAARYLLPEDEIFSAIEERGRRTSTLVYLCQQYGVSFETLIYRLHNLQLIDAQGRDRLIELSWQQLVNQSSEVLRRSGFSQPEIGKLLSRNQLNPEERFPALLVRRAFDGFRKGLISVRPLAGLLKEDSTELLERLSAPDIELQFLEMPQVPRQDRGVTLEDLFAGSPVQR